MRGGERTRGNWEWRKDPGGVMIERIEGVARRKEE